MKQLSSYPKWEGNEYQPKCGDALWLWSQAPHLYRTGPLYFLSIRAGGQLHQYVNKVSP